MGDEDSSSDILSERGLVITDGGDRLGEVLEAMTDRRRRYTLYYLQEEETADIDTLAAHVAAWERHFSIEELPDDVHSEVKIDLYHNHLPKLQDAALVEYDRRSNSVRYRFPSGLLSELLRLAAKIERP